MKGAPPGPGILSPASCPGGCWCFDVDWSCSDVQQQAPNTGSAVCSAEAAHAEVGPHGEAASGMSAGWGGSEAGHQGCKAHARLASHQPLANSARAQTGEQLLGLSWWGHIQFT